MPGFSVQIDRRSAENPCEMPKGSASWHDVIVTKLFCYQHGTNIEWGPNHFKAKE